MEPVPALTILVLSSLMLDLAVDRIRAPTTELVLKLGSCLAVKILPLAAVIRPVLPLEPCPALDREPVPATSSRFKSDLTLAMEMMHLRVIITVPAMVELVR